jgi:hypothetical protein
MSVIVEIECPDEVLALEFKSWLYTQLQHFHEHEEADVDWECQPPNVGLTPVRRFVLVRKNG